MTQKKKRPAPKQRYRRPQIRWRISEGLRLLLKQGVKFDGLEEDERASLLAALNYVEELADWYEYAE